MSAPFQLVNGNAADHPLLSDRGLYYGHGLFETIRCQLVGGTIQAPLWDEHMARLATGCQRLSIAITDTQINALADQRDQLLQQAGFDSAVIKIIVTAGSGGRGYAMPESLSPTIVVQVSEWVDDPRDPARD